MVRLAVPGDLDVIVTMGVNFHQHTQYRDLIAADPDAMRTTAERLVFGDQGDILVAESDGAIIGMLGICVYHHPISGQLFATELFWWVEPDRRGTLDSVRLLAEAEKWAVSRGAAVLQMIAPSSTPEINNLYARRGFRPIEISYQKELVP